MKTALFTFALWTLSMLIARILFDGLSAQEGYSLVFGWCLVLYVTNLKCQIGLVDIAISFGLGVLVFLSVFLSGNYDHIYHGVPA